MVTGGYVRFSWYLSAAEHAENQSNGLYPDHASYPLYALDVRKEGRADIDSFAALAERIGKSYKWDRRKVFQDSTERMKMAEKLEKGGAERLSFHVNGHEVGGAVLARDISTQSIIRAFDLASMRRPEAFHEDMAKNIVEVCTFGIFPEYTSYHLGRPFIVETFRAAFARKDLPVSGVYLETRSTDSERMRGILNKLQLPVIDGISLPDDLVL